MPIEITPGLVITAGITFGDEEPTLPQSDPESELEPESDSEPE